jgi:hypothetical protein
MYLNQTTEPRRVNIALLEATFVRTLQHHRQELDWIDYKKLDGGRYNIYQQNDGNYIGCFIFSLNADDVTTIIYQRYEKFDELFQRIMTILDTELEYNSRIAEAVRTSPRFSPLSMPTETRKPEPPAPTTQITKNINIKVQGNVNGDMIVGDENKIEH